MYSQMSQIERVARLAMGDFREQNSSDPLPPGPNYSPFGYFRLSIMIFAAFVAILLALMIL
ncbi:hypothetical protein GRZ55_02770 [Chelativorans sp. ZYF759]|uniref:hypothetical protein n=1 Tax=Chelativorans sp. ZYF759 TaxID=2692213 RepID=UPI00145DD651|nr:hypothetical protein [Chelativorans sp. ZYF759]NMG38162.1 hypothetical protein [Chelativorans sp. ZYF759]